MRNVQICKYLFVEVRLCSSHLAPERRTMTKGGSDKGTNVNSPRCGRTLERFSSKRGCFINPPSFRDVQVHDVEK